MKTGPPGDGKKMRKSGVGGSVVLRRIWLDLEYRDETMTTAGRQEGRGNEILSLNLRIRRIYFLMDGISCKAQPE